MSHEQNGNNPEMKENIDSQTPRATGGTPGQGQYVNQAQPPYPAGASQNLPPDYAQPGYHAMPQEHHQGGTGHPPVQNNSQMPNWPHHGPGYQGHQAPGWPYQAQNQANHGHHDYAQPGYYAMPPNHHNNGVGYPPVQNGHQMPSWPPQNNGYYGHQTPAWPYQNHYYAPHPANPGYPPMPENNQPTNGGLASFLNFRDERFLKGALVGAAVTFLLTNDSVQKNAIQSIVKVWNLFQGGLEEVKERFRDAEAEIKAEDKS